MGSGDALEVAAVGGARLLLTRSSEDDARFALPQLLERFPPLFAHADAASTYVGLPFARAALDGWDVEPNLGPSRPHLELLKPLSANLSSAAAVPFVASLARAACALSCTSVIADGGTTTLAARSPCLLIAHLEGRTSPTMLGKSLHVHFTMEPDDFLRWYLRTPAASWGRGVDGSDIFFVRSAHARELEEAVVGGALNTPAFLRGASYHLKDSGRAERCLVQTPDELSLELRAGWSGLEAADEARITIVPHPCRPRLGLALDGVHMLGGDADLGSLLLRAGLALDRAFREANENASPAARVTSSKGDALPVDGALALRLGEAWEPAGGWPTPRGHEDAHFAALEQRGTHVLALWETSPWVYVALLRGIAAGAADGVRWAAPADAPTPRAWFDAFQRPWTRTRGETGTVYHPI